MASVTATATPHEAGSHGKLQFYVVWILLLLSTGIEVSLAYIHLPAIRMLSILLGLSVFKAALIIYYFMHLKYEITPMRRMLMTALVVCLMLMCIFFPDAFRILRLGVAVQ
jgi:cytochrome c oxidase subunit 4